MRGAGIYGGRAPEPVADPGELSREMDRIEPEEPRQTSWNLGRVCGRHPGYRTWRKNWRQADERLVG